MISSSCDPVTHGDLHRHARFLGQRDHQRLAELRTQPELVQHRVLRFVLTAPAADLRFVAEVLVGRTRPRDRAGHRTGNRPLRLIERHVHFVDADARTGVHLV